MAQQEPHIGNNASTTDPYKCTACHADGIDTSCQTLCNVCRLSLCDKCWDNCLPHRINPPSPGIPHEKTNIGIANKIRDILQPKRSDAEEEELHRTDECTTWFGVDKDENDGPVFQDYGLYAEIMAEFVPEKRRDLHPGLISFVGQTGAGKSTIVRLLVELRNSGNQEYPTPVVGSVRGANRPTSGDVHLYIDPQSFKTQTPMLYADCEGLGGGDIQPISLRVRDQSKDPTGVSLYSRCRSKYKKFNKRKITWMDSETPPGREFAVGDLYPRFLYTFSDVIVFVQENTRREIKNRADLQPPRTTDSVIEMLLKWANSALETSSNQPVLPHAIITLNKSSENGCDAGWWDTNNATKWLFNPLEGQFYSNPKFSRYLRFWTERGKKIDSIHDLLLCYYASIRVVRIPALVDGIGRPNLLKAQVDGLYMEISSANRESRHNKRSLRMLLSADQLHSYLQYAFDHFSSNKDTPFDFVQASFANNPIPQDFGGNILKLAINIRDVRPGEPDGPGIFMRDLSPIVASCIMLDSARHKTLGEP
ncbi:hypothetical protein FGG08_000444 [Glutinoglossum americanum]|uniref:Uncharacterized protein n=1 Tax=Glutinoglossum americanum TaxID=1670608 RepID=A0A9P8L180_9PEZI|nr:hypothetical protein FGG08_000444 [Glutinoglossum americanum]